MSPSSTHDRISTRRTFPCPGRLALAAAVFILSFSGSELPAQTPVPGAHSVLPATPPTTAANASAPLAATFTGVASSRPQVATVSYSDGLLDVRANNSSLNAILREVARATGMRLTGSVADQRVFGNYGPSDPATVLATLLDGTGANMLFREAAEMPAELILTPRTGGPSPPSPPSPEEANSAPVPTPNFGNTVDPSTIELQRQRAASIYGMQGQNGQASPNVVPSQPVGVQGPGQNVEINGLSPSIGTPSAQSTGALGTGLTGTGTAPAIDPNGDAKTPEQVYQLLQQLRQQSIREQGGKQQ